MFGLALAFTGPFRLFAALFFFARTVGLLFLFLIALAGTRLFFAPFGAFLGRALLVGLGRGAAALFFLRLFAGTFFFLFFALSGAAGVLLAFFFTALFALVFFCLFAAAGLFLFFAFLSALPGLVGLTGAAL